MNQQTLNDIEAIQEENKKVLEFLNFPANKDKQFATDTTCVHHGDVVPKTHF